MADYLTQDDVENYGPELIDVTQRAALQAVAPHLQNLESQNAQLQQRLAVESRRRLDQQIAAAVPDYQEVDRNPAWHRWLLGIDHLSGRVRQTLLNEAIAVGDPPSCQKFLRWIQARAWQLPIHAWNQPLHAAWDPHLHPRADRSTLREASKGRLFRFEME
jgi:hypothetical protein